MAELKSVCGVADLYDMLEVAVVMQHNDRLAAAMMAKENNRGR